MSELLTNDQIFIRKLTEMIHENIRNEDFGVKELARESGMSLYSLSRKLHSTTRQTVNQFIREVRLREALKLLQSEDITASEVAYKVGFSSPGYFNKCFHEFFGYPPGKVKIGDQNNWEQNALTQVMAENNLKKITRRYYILTFPSILILVALIGIIGFLIYIKINISGGADIPVSSDGRISIAVMPFRNLTNDTIWNIWQEGIQEDLITYLSNNKELKVRQKGNINILLQTRDLMNYSSISTVVAGRISQKLDAGIYIYGSIQKAGFKIRLDAQLINTKTGDVLKSVEVDGPFKEEMILSLTDSLRQKVTDFLKISKLVNENPVYGSITLSTNSSEAFKYYLYGDKANEKGDNPAAISWYLKALAIDSNFFEPMIRLSSVYGNLGMIEQDLQWVLKYYKKKDQWPAAQQIAASWAYACSFESPEEQIKYLKQGQQIEDEDPSIPYFLGLTYNSIKQYDKSIPELEICLKINKKWSEDFLKNNWAYWMLGEAYDKTGQYDKEKKLYREALHYIPETWLTTRQALLAFAEKDTGRANLYIEKYLSVKRKISSSEADIDQGLGDIYFQAGLLDRAEGYYRKALSLDSGNLSRINNLANFLVESNRNLKDVSGLVSKALELTKDSVAYYNCYLTKGKALYKQGLYKEGLETLQEIWDKAPFKLYTYKYSLEEVKKAISGLEKQ